MNPSLKRGTVDPRRQSNWNSKEDAKSGARGCGGRAAWLFDDDLLDRRVALDGKKLGELTRRLLLHMLARVVECL